MILVILIKFINLLNLIYLRRLWLNLIHLLWKDRLEGTGRHTEDRSHTENGRHMEDASHTENGRHMEDASHTEDASHDQKYNLITY